MVIWIRDRWVGPKTVISLHRRAVDDFVRFASSSSFLLFYIRSVIKNLKRFTKITFQLRTPFAPILAADDVVRTWKSGVSFMIQQSHSFDWSHAASMCPHKRTIDNVVTVSRKYIYITLSLAHRICKFVVNRENWRRIRGKEEEEGEGKNTICN